MTNWLSKLEKGENTYIASKAPNVFENIVFSPSPSLNYAIGGKGFVFGRCPLFYGPRSSGKSTHALALLAQIHKTDPKAYGIYISTEYDFSPERATNVGVVLERTLVKNTNVGKEIFDWIDNEIGDLCDQGAPIKYIAIDTVGMIRGPKELNSESTDEFQIGDLAAYVGKGLNWIVDTIRSKKILLVLVQQARWKEERIGRYTKGYWDYPGGKALTHFADYVCLFERIERKDSLIFDESRKMINGNLEQIGHRVRVKVEKNRLGPPDRVAEFDFQYDKGVVNVHQEIAELALNLGIIEKPNNLTYKYKEQTWKGKDTLIKTVLEDTKLQTILYKDILEYAQR